MGSDRIDSVHVEVAAIRQRMLIKTNLLIAFNGSLVTSSGSHVEALLHLFIDEIRQGKHGGSVLSRETTSSLQPDEKEAWRLIRKELEGIGISPELSTEHRNLIVAIFEQAIADGALNEGITDVFESVPSSPCSSISRDTGLGDVSPASSHHIVVDLGLLANETRQEMTQSVAHKPRTEERAQKTLAPSARNARFPRSTARVIFWWLRNRDKQLRTSKLFTAARKGRWEAASNLLEAGEDATFMSGRGESTLHLAAKGGQTNVIRKLLEKGAKVDLRDLSSRTPLSWAVARDQYRAAEVLPVWNAAPDMSDKNGDTPLHWAAKAE
ncbi:MAG: hypothetical protein M1838_001921 [Thelocarpon superellum]|nr:MAG: hypothetical protein M1838_001921 [Thelocarpon superellum]